VDFGSSWRYEMEDVFGRISAQLHDRMRTVDSKIGSALARARKFTEQLVARAHNLSGLDLQRVEEVKEEAKIHAAHSSETLTELAKSVSMDLAKHSVILSKEISNQASQAKERVSRGLRTLKHFNTHLEDALLRAQVRSKLYWLQLQGKQSEYDEYESKAAEATRRKTERPIKEKRAAHSKKLNRAARKAAKKEAKRSRSAERAV